MPKFADSDGTTVRDINALLNPNASTTLDADTVKREETTADVLTKGPFAVAAGFADTVGQSIGLFDENDVTQFLKQTVPSLGSFYQRNRTPARTVGDLTGMLIPGTLAVKLLNTTSRLARGSEFIMGMGKTGDILTRSLFTSAGKRDEVLRTLRARDRFLAERGTLDKLSAADETRRRLVRQARMLTTSDSIKESVAFELGIAATMNESDLLFPDEASTGDLLALASLGIVIPLSIDTLLVNRAIRASAQGVSGFAEEALNPGYLPLNVDAPKPGQRDLSITVSAVAAAHARQTAKEFEGEGVELVQQNMNRFNNSLLGAQKSQIEALQKEAFMKLESSTGQRLITGSRAPTPGVTQTVMNALEHDPTLLLGTKSIENVFPGSVRGREEIRQQIVKDIDAKIGEITVKYPDPDDLLKQSDLEELAKLQAQRNFYNGLEEVVIETNGSIRLAQTRREIFHDVQDPLGQINVRRATQNEPGALFVKDKNVGTISFTDDGLLIFGRQNQPLIAGLSRPRGGTNLGRRTNNFETLDFKQRSAVYALMQRQAERFQLGKAKTAIVVNETSHHTTLDYVQELHRRHGDDIFKTDVQLGGNFQNMDDLAFASLSGKFDEYQRIRQVMDDTAQARIRAAGHPSEFAEDDLAMMLNLPSAGDGSLHPLLGVFEGIYIEEGFVGLSKIFRNMEDFQRAIQEDAFFPEITQFLNRNIDTTGNMMQFNFNNRPALLVKSPVDPASFTRDGIRKNAEMNRAVVMNALSRGDQNNASLVKVITDTLNNAAATNIAREVGLLSEAGVRGSGAIVQQSFARGEQPTLQAMQALEQNTDQIFRKATGAIFNDVAVPGLASKLTPVQVFTALRRSTGDLESFNLFAHSRRQAWDLTGRTVERDGKIFYEAKKNAFNKGLFEKHFGTRTLPEEFFMPAPTPAIDGVRTYQALGVTQLAADGARTFAYLDGMILDNLNHLKGALGRPTTSRKEFHLPPKNFAGGETTFVIDEVGQLDFVANGRTIQEANRLAAKHIDQRKGEGRNVFAVDRSNMVKYFDLQDEAFSRLLDFSDPLNQTGRATGRSVGGIVEVGQRVLDDMVLSVESGFESVLRRTRAAYFEPQINYAKQLLNVSNTTSARKGQSVFQQYLASIFGNRTLHPNDTIGRHYFALESTFDEILKVMHDKYADLRQPGIRVGTSPQEEARFDALSKALGGVEHTPFNSALEFAQNTHKVSAPLRTKEALANLNRLTSFLTLRMFEVGHAVLTTTSLGATVPAVINGLRRHALESSKQHAARIGAFGVKVSDNHSYFSASRALVSTVHSYFNDKSFRAAMDRAAKQGYFDQNVSEIFKTLTAPRQGYAATLATKAGNIVSKLSDKSEVFARGFAFATGYNIAKKALNLTDDTNAFIFAKRFADETIGNYSPNNRPRVFQGAVGMPLGLFMTFMTNYYQRIFSYVENKDVRAAITQFATQASVFGGSTVPGFEQFAGFFASQADGTHNPVDGMRNQFGDAFTEAVLYGSLSNLPKWFGADDGIALYTRGDVGIKQIPIIDFERAAPFQMINNTIQAIGKGVGMLKEQGFNDARIAEIISQYSVNRTARNAAGIYNALVNDAPQAVDRRGQVVNEDVLTEMSIAARLMGLRTTSEAQNVALMYRIRTTELSQRSKMTRLRDNVRQQIREGDLNLDVAMENYVRYGGSPENFPAWLTRQSRIAITNRATLELLRKFGNERKAYDTIRLLNTLDPQQLENVQ